MYCKDHAAAAEAVVVDDAPKVQDDLATASEGDEASKIAYTLVGARIQGVMGYPVPAASNPSGGGAGFWPGQAKVTGNDGEAESGGVVKVIEVDFPIQGEGVAVAG